jgi:UDP-N-acetylmuramyl pentapeptide phosphotransferase/UDP-N-acetylglucosamine-1-phosphate transferase
MTGHWLDDPRNVRRLWRGFLAVLALTVLAELVVALHPHFAVEALFGFHAAFGFLACAAMIAAAKALGALLKRPDRHYEEPEDV